METQGLIDELKQIKVQYESEVGTGGRKVWPRSIRDRVAQLFTANLSGVKVAEQTGLPYYTDLKWRPRQKPRGRNAFRELAVVKSAPLNSKNLATVTESQNFERFEVQKVATVTMTTPDGYRLEVQTPEMALELIRSLGRE